MNNLDIFSGAKVLVTGHTGFKGSWLALWLGALGAQVTGISDQIPTAPSHFEAANIASSMDHRFVNIENYDAVYDVVKEVKPEFIFHLAAQPLVQKSFIDPLKTWQTNTIGTLNLLEAIRTNDERVTAVFVTSDKAYDNVEWEWGYRENDRLGGPDPYSASKGGAELVISSYVRSYFANSEKIRIGVGRAGNVIGGGDWAESRIVPDIARAWSAGSPVVLRNPSSTRPWQHVLEPLSGYLQLAVELHSSDALHGEAFNFGPSTLDAHSVIDVVTEMSDYWDAMPWELESGDPLSTKESKLLKLNCDKALFHLEWRSIWDFRRTVKETATWYKDFYSSGPLDISELSLGQIKKYCEDAAILGLRWAN